MSRAVAVPKELTLGPFRGADAVARGLLTRRQLAGGSWVRLFPDIFVWKGLPLTRGVRRLAAALFLDGRGAISGLDAAAFWGADACREAAPIEVTVPGPLHLNPQPGLRIVRSSLPAGDYLGSALLLVTSPLRTAFDLARHKDRYSSIPGIDALIAARLVAKEHVVALADARKGWRGRHRVRETLRLCDGRAESPQESRLRLVLVVGRLPGPVTQFEVRDAMGRFVARLDLAYPTHKVGVEYDGDHHRTRTQFRSDLRRLNDLSACGWTVLRFAAADLYDPDTIVATVRAALT